MPYITTREKKMYDQEINYIVARINHPGQLTYVIYALCLGVLAKLGKEFSTLCMITGVLTCVSKEFYRKETAPYEDEKIEQNGDVTIKVQL